MWLPDVMTSTPAAKQRVRGRRRQAHATGDVLAVGGHEVDAARLAETRQQLLDGLPARLADQVADHQHPAGAGWSRGIAIGGVPESGQADRGGSAYFAYSTARVSRMTVTLIWPG